MLTYSTQLQSRERSDYVPAPPPIYSADAGFPRKAAVTKIALAARKKALNGIIDIYDGLQQNILSSRSCHSILYAELEISIYNHWEFLRFVLNLMLLAWSCVAAVRLGEKRQSSRRPETRLLLLLQTSSVATLSPRPLNLVCKKRLFIAVCSSSLVADIHRCDGIRHTFK